MKSRRQNPRALSDLRRLVLAAIGLHDGEDMTKSDTAMVLNQHSVTIEFDGRTVSGACSVWAGLITVASAHGRKVTQIDGNSTVVLADDVERAGGGRKGVSLPNRSIYGLTPES